MTEDDYEKKVCEMCGLVGNFNPESRDPVPKMKAFIHMHNIHGWAIGRFVELRQMLEDHNNDTNSKTREYCLNEMNKVIRKTQDEFIRLWEEAEKQEKAGIK